MSPNVLPNIVAAVGRTPLIRLSRIAEGCGATILLKAEFLNPLSSVKDRIGAAMIAAAEAQGKLKTGSVVVEPTSGNTGIALAFVCAQRGYKLILTMPESMSLERRVLLRMLGAEIVLTPANEGMPGAIRRADEVLRGLGEFGYMPHQFENPANPEAHRRTTAEEIWSDTEGRIDAFVAGVGTGGTLTGVAGVLKTRTKILTVAVEPAASPVLAGGAAGRHRIQGIGAGFVPKNCDRSLIDEIIPVTDDAALETARALALLDGIPAGISTGANVWAALELAKRPAMAGKTIVTVGCSCSERYLSTALADKARTEVTV